MTEIMEIESKLSPAATEFILHWGNLGSQWGVNRSVAQIHALLFISDRARHAEEIADLLGLARSNVSNSIKELLAWRLIDRVPLLGDRRDHFTAEKDIWKVATQIIKERKKRELDPMLKLLSQLENIDGDKKDRESKQFTEMIGSIKKLGNQADKMLDVMIKAEEHWFTGNILKIFK